MPWSQRYHWNLILYLSQQHCVLPPCFMVNGSLPTADTVMLSKSAKLGDIVVSFSLTCAFFLISCGHLCEDETWCVSGSYTPLYTWQWLCGGCHGYTSGGIIGESSCFAPAAWNTDFKFFFFFSYFTTSVVFGWKNAKKEETNVAVLYTFLTFQEPQFVLMLWFLLPLVVIRHKYLLIDSRIENLGKKWNLLT